MDKKSAWLLVGAGTGLTLAWLFRSRIAGLFGVSAKIDESAEIIVETGHDGRPHVVYVTPEVIVKKNKHVRWQVGNGSNVDVVVALADWQDESHRPVRPAVDADPDDHEHPPQQDLSRKVPAQKSRPIRGRARGPSAGHVEKVKYAVHLDGNLEVDPIVKLTL
jgi:hypothetical protein